MGEMMMDQIGIQTQGLFYYSRILNQMSLLALIFEPVWSSNFYDHPTIMCEDLLKSVLVCE